MEHAENKTKLMSAKEVRAIFGGISDMSLWRWLQDEQMGFPAPIYIAKRRFFREVEIMAFIEKQAAQSGSAA
ncbi:helix-turn-helix transcriptional regulator [Celeribacter sp.]|uniref:helix-turn-helix transcriptional regulator n=1 Tax=Celeribacter sp. TaxID=1890673 RepID=UPI003A8FE294